MDSFNLINFKLFMLHMLCHIFIKSNDIRPELFMYFASIIQTIKGFKVNFLILLVKNVLNIHVKL